MEELLIKTIKEMGYPIIKQGSLSEDENYPDNTSDDGSHYDNESNTYIWDFDLNVYSSDPEKINKLLLDAKEKLIKKEFIVNGKGHDLISDEPTHTGRGINVQIIEK